MNLKTLKRMIIPIMLAILTAIATIYAVVQQEQDKKTAEEEAKNEKERALHFENDLRKVNNELKKANSDLQDKQEKLLEKANENTAAALKLAEVYKQLSDTQKRLEESTIEFSKLTNGYGSPLITNSGYSKGYNSFVIQNHDNYSFKNVTIEAIYMNNVAKCYDLKKKKHYVDSECYKVNRLTVFQADIINSSTQKEIQMKLSSNNLPQFVQFNIRCNHGTFVQYMIFGKDPHTDIVRTMYKLFEYKGINNYQFISEDNPFDDNKIWENNFIFARSITVM